jgi:hypothetical protein
VPPKTANRCATAPIAPTPIIGGAATERMVEPNSLTKSAPCDQQAKYAMHGSARPAVRAGESAKPIGARVVSFRAEDQGLRVADDVV